METTQYGQFGQSFSSFLFLFTHLLTENIKYEQYKSEVPDPESKKVKD